MSYTKQYTATKGKLEVICGPMFSGKSEELIRRLRRATIAKRRVAIFKHALDNRYMKQQIVSHNGTHMDAHATNDPQYILNEVEKNTISIVGIDEIQFFDATIIPAICTLIDQGVRVIASGLDLDHCMLPFGPMPTLLAIADSIAKLKAICTKCGADAHLTQRTVQTKDNPILMVGADDVYQARCRSCFIPPILSEKQVP